MTGKYSLGTRLYKQITISYRVRLDERVNCSTQFVLNLNVERQQVRCVSKDTGYGLIAGQKEGHTAGDHLFLC